MNKLFLGIIIFVYSIGFILTIVFIVNFCIVMNRLDKKAKKRGDEKKRGEYFQKALWKFSKQIFIKNSKFHKQLNKEGFLNPLAKIFLGIIEFFKIIFGFPIFIIRLVCIIYRPAWIWNFPFSLYELWMLILIVFSFSLSKTGNFIFGVMIPIMTALFALTNIFDYFKPDKKGIMRLLTMPKHKLRIWEVIENWILLIISFGAIFYSVGLKFPESFSGPLSTVDSIYFSFVTITTLGYGDIVPKTLLSKSIVITEVTLGCIFIVVVFTTFLNVWLKRKNEKIDDKSSEEDAIILPPK